MPLPFIIGGIAAIAGIAGVGSGIHGGMKMKEANDTIKSAQSKQGRAMKLFQQRNKETTDLMDSLGKQELEILKSFNEFSDIIEKIQGRPEFKEYSKEGVNIPKYTAKHLQEVSVGAAAWLGAMGGAVAGTAGGFAATGATVIFGTASTGAAISTLSGAAATNATLAALGGGTIAAGGGGMALGSAVLGGATLGVGLLVGGVIFNFTGSKLSDKADNAYGQASRTEEKVNEIVKYFNELSSVAGEFKDTLTKVQVQYKKRLDILDSIVNVSKKTLWTEFSNKEQRITENTVLLVGLLYKMCKVSLVIKSEEKDGLNSVNSKETNKVISDAENILNNLKDED